MNAFHRRGLIVSALLFGVSPLGDALAARPNVILVITDDQGYGDIGAHGNEMIRTPNLDRLHGESVRLTNFHVDPTCSPTRSAVMSGRYSTRTGVWHTIMGRSLMSTDEITLAEALAAGGYRTGMFGKWHLGDNFPCRPQDQGFEKTWHHGGGGITQTPDWWGNDYFDDTYINERGESHAFKGYCTDVWFDTALDFIKQRKDSGDPFFCYLATNAPHGPFNVDEKYEQPYVDAGVPQPMAKFYGMITNIDENMGRLVHQLDEWELTEKTLLIFMTDNGTAAGVARAKPQATWTGFNADMRGQKGSEYDGGHRVPCFIRWPEGNLTGGRDIDTLTAHIDLLPTVRDLCDVDKPDGPPLDGTSLVPLLTGEVESLGDRTLFVHSQRLEHVQKWRKSAVMTERWRLINGNELYDIQSDPGQQTDVATGHPDEVAKLRAAYEGWWDSLSPVFDDAVRITLGSDRENPSHLTCHDWHTDDGPVPWNQNAVSKNPSNNGRWTVHITQPGNYEFRLRLRPAGVHEPIPAGEVRLQIGQVEATTTTDGTTDEARLTLNLQPGPATLQSWLTEQDGTERGAYFVEVERLD
ncbi:MAG: arylsulfatase [Planctomycetaceae bacterium]|nr:arylsulfatase [Planctomycetaceae bacterium]